MPYDPNTANDYSKGLQFDERGRPFFAQMNGQRDYIAPQQGIAYAMRGDERVATWLKSMGITPDATGNWAGASASGPGGKYDGGGYFKNATGWDHTTGTWKKGGMDWWNTLVTAGAGGALAAPFVAGGGAAAGVGGTPTAAYSTPGMVPSAAGSAASGAISTGAGIAGTGASGLGYLAAIDDDVIPGTPTAKYSTPGMIPNTTPGSGNLNGTPNLGGYTPGNMPGGNSDSNGYTGPGLSTADKLKDIIKGLLPAIAGAAGGFVGGSGDSGPGGGGGMSDASNAQLDALIKMASDRAQRTDPLHQMVTRLAEQRMPIRSRTA